MPWTCSTWPACRAQVRAPVREGSLLARCRAHNGARKLLRVARPSLVPCLPPCRGAPWASQAPHQAIADPLPRDPRRVGAGRPSGRAAAARLLAAALASEGRRRNVPGHQPRMARAAVAGAAPAREVGAGPGPGPSAARRTHAGECLSFTHQLSRRRPAGGGAEASGTGRGGGPCRSLRAPWPGAEPGAVPRRRLICTGALTNAALLLILYPEVQPMLEVVLMGGAMGVGNTGAPARSRRRRCPDHARLAASLQRAGPGGPGAHGQPGAASA
jgi:hypothetical protein